MAAGQGSSNCCNLGMIIATLLEGGVCICHMTHGLLPGGFARPEDLRAAMSLGPEYVFELYTLGCRRNAHI